MAVSTLPGEMELRTLLVYLILAQIEADTLVYQPVHASSAVANGKLNSIPVAQAATRIKRIFNVGIDSIARMQYCGHPALSPIGGALFQVCFADQGNSIVPGQVQCQAETGGAAANYQHIVFVPGRAACGGSNRHRSNACS